MNAVRSFLLLFSWCLFALPAFASVGQFYVFSSGFQSYYAGGATGAASPCYNSGNNRVYESSHFLIYSAGSSDVAVQTLASLAEDELVVLSSRLQFDISPFAASAASKFKVCADAVTSNGGNYGGAASGLGMSITAVDNPSVSASVAGLNYQLERRLIRHEMMHYIQALAVGSTNIFGDSGVDRWFSEGLADYVADQEVANTGAAITNWFAAGKINPATVVTYQDQGNNAAGDIYPYYASIIAYIFSTQGANNSLPNVMSVYAKMKIGATFSTAFSSVLKNSQGQALTTASVQSNYVTWLSAFWVAQESKLTVQNGSVAVAGILGSNDDPNADYAQYSATGSFASGQWAFNVSSFPDGTYKLYFGDKDPPTVLTGPIIVAVKSGVVQATNCNLSQLTCSGTPAPKATPQSGWWWNASEGGRGYFIEVKNGRFFIASFLYDNSGFPAWYVTGPGNSSGSTLAGTLGGYRGGQSLTGAYKLPSGPTSAGSFSVTFTDATHGTITWPGGNVPIVRFPIASGSLSLADPAFKPETGWWWNASEGGRGFSIEIQGDNMFVAGFMYDASGNPMWYVSGGKMTNSNYYQGTWQQCANGQSITSAYRLATCTNVQSGSVAINFSSTTTATMLLPDGRQLSLTRYSF